MTRFRAASVSVILVSYYNTHNLHYCLPALFDTIPPETQVVLIDNANGDTGLDWIAAAFPRVELIRSPHNGGYGSANNVAARLSDSRYLVFLNPDTIPHPGWLERLIELLETQPAVGLVTPKILLLAEPGKINTCGNTVHITGISLCRGVRAPETAFGEPDRVSAVSGACFAIRRSLFVELDGFDETFFMYMEDTDLSLRARLTGCEIAYLPEAVIEHDYALEFNESKIFLQERNRYLMLLKAFKWPTLFILLPALLMAEAVTWGFVLLRERKGIAQKFLAYGWIVRNWPLVMQKRNDVQRHRRAGDRQLLKALVWHVDVRQLGDFLVSRIAEKVFDAFFAPYHWLLNRFILW